jgi:hypothetical protein
MTAMNPMRGSVFIDSVEEAGVQSAVMRRLLWLGVATFSLYGASELLESAIAHPSAGDGLQRQGLLYALYLLVTAGILGSYGAILAIGCRGELARRQPRALALGMACVLQVVLAVLPPQLSQDILTYTAQGLLGMHGHNPMAEPATAARLALHATDLAAAGWRDDDTFTPYGIIWTWIEMGMARLAGGSVPITVLLLKGVALAASLLTAFMLGRLLERVAPRMKHLGVLAYLWNPLLLVELAGEGHNDALLLLCAITTLSACAAGRPGVSVLAQLCGVLTKYVTILLLPPQLVYLWRTRQGGRARLILEMLAGMLIAGALAAVLYAPVWIGLQSFTGLAQQATPMSSASLFGMINWALRRSPLMPLAGGIAMAAVALPTVALIAWISLGVRDIADLTRAFAWIAVLYVLVTAPVYWPWYTCLPVMLLLAADPRRYLWVVILLSAVARAVAPLDLLQVHGFLSMPIAKGLMTGLGTTLPLLVLLAWLVLRDAPAVAPRPGGQPASK